MSLGRIFEIRAHNSDFPKNMVVDKVSVMCAFSQVQTRPKVSTGFNPTFSLGFD